MSATLCRRLPPPLVTNDESRWLTKTAFQPTIKRSKSHHLMHTQRETYLDYIINHCIQLAVGKREIDLFTVVCSVAWPLHGSEAGVDLVLIKTSLLLFCKSGFSDAN